MTYDDIPYYYIGQENETIETSKIYFEERPFIVKFWDKVILYCCLK